MAVNFNEAVISNRTGTTLSLSPWNCDLELPPGGVAPANCASDGVIDQATNLSYAWTTMGTIEPATPCAFTSVTPQQVHLIEFCGGTQRVFVAEVIGQTAAPPAASDSGA
jgi:hypothetical protein